MRQLKRRMTTYRKLVMLMTMVIVISIFPMPSVRADKCLDTKEELEEAEKVKKEKEAALQEAESKLQDTESQLAALQSEKNSYQGQMNNLNTELQLVADNLAVIEAEKDLKQLEIDETKALLEATRESCQLQYESMKCRIRFLYEQGDMLYTDVLLSSQSFGEFLSHAQYIEKMNEYDRKMLNEYIETERTISENMAVLEDELAEMEELENQALDEQNKVNNLISSTAESLAATEDSMNGVEAAQQAYEADCDQKAAEAAAANAEYEAIKAQYEEELRLSQLAAQSSWRDISQVQFEEGDRYLLANLIYCEAGNQSYEGQLAVGAVVVNRVLSDVFPDTVTGVIYQNKQFSPVGDGHLASALANNKATASCYQAADEALSGATNVGNCVFFRTPIEGITGIQIGAHIFY